MEPVLSAGLYRIVRMGVYQLACTTVLCTSTNQYYSSTAVLCTTQYYSSTTELCITQYCSSTAVLVWGFIVKAEIS